MKQPTKDALREQLALAADEIIRLRKENKWLKWRELLWANVAKNSLARKRAPWWRRWSSADKCKAACEADNG